MDVEDQLRLSIGKVSKYLKEKYVPLYNLMFVIKGHPHRVHPYIS